MCVSLGLKHMERCPPVTPTLSPLLSRSLPDSKVGAAKDLPLRAYGKAGHTIPSKYS